MEELVDALPALAAIVVSAFIILWCVVRPLSFRYRIDSGNLVVLTFFVLPSARIPLERIKLLDPQENNSSPPSRRRVLAPLHLRLLQTPCLAVSGQELLVLPHWHRTWLGAAEPEQAFELARETRHELPLFLRAPAASQLSGDNALQLPLALATWTSALWRRWTKYSASLVTPAADALILLPLWLTWLDWAGACLLAAEYPWSKAWILKACGPAHFGASAFVLLCGLTVRTLLALRLRIPLSIGIIALVAALSRLSIQHQWAHEYSHAFFDSCTGYDDVKHGVSILIFLCGWITFSAAWDQWTGSRIQAFRSPADAATP